MQPTISAIAAIGKNRELGKHNDLIWRISADLQRLKELTTGHPIIMGRKTYESIGRPLPNRTNIIVTRDTSFEAEGCVVVHTLGAAIEHASTLDTEEIFIFGGATLYEAALPLIEKLYLTVIDDTDPAADVWFPAYKAQFSVVHDSGPKQDGDLTYSWLDLVRTTQT